MIALLGILVAMLVVLVTLAVVLSPHGTSTALAGANGNTPAPGSTTLTATTAVPTATTAAATPTPGHIPAPTATTAPTVTASNGSMSVAITNITAGPLEPTLVTAVLSGLPYGLIGKATLADSRGNSYAFIGGCVTTIPSNCVPLRFEPVAQNLVGVSLTFTLTVTQVGDFSQTPPATINTNLVAIVQGIPISDATHLQSQGITLSLDSASYGQGVLVVHGHTIGDPTVVFPAPGVQNLTDSYNQHYTVVNTTTTKNTAHNGYDFIITFKLVKDTGIGPPPSVYFVAMTMSNQNVGMLYGTWSGMVSVG